MMTALETGLTAPAFSLSIYYNKYIHLWELSVAKRPANAVTFRKRADTLALEIKARIVAGEFRPGDRLPRERDLAEEYGVSKWTIRETLKSLEVQGLVRIGTGPNGGATLVEVSESRAMEQLCQFFYFRPLTAAQIYEVRVILEPELAASAVGRLNEAQLVELEELIRHAEAPADTKEKRRSQRDAELAFHDVIASASPNTWLAFNCRMMNRLLADKVVFGRMHLSPHQKFARDNCHWHEKLLAAFRAEDREVVRKLMAGHIQAAASYMVQLEAEIDPRQLMAGNE